MNARTNPLVEDYLTRLGAAAMTLPPDRRADLVSEIRGHLDEGLRESGTADETSVRNLLERLGSPEEIVSAELDSTTTGRPGTPEGPANGSAVVSVVLGVLWIMGIGSVLALVFGYRARREIAASGGIQRGSILATVGIVLGWVGLAMLVLVILGGISLVVGSAGGGSVPVEPVGS